MTWQANENERGCRVHRWWSHRAHRDHPACSSGSSESRVALGRQVLLEGDFRSAFAGRDVELRRELLGELKPEPAVRAGRDRDEPARVVDDDPDARVVTSARILTTSSSGSAACSIAFAHTSQAASRRSSASDARQRRSLRARFESHRARGASERSRLATSRSSGFGATGRNRAAKIAMSSARSAPLTSSSSTCSSICSASSGPSRMADTSASIPSSIESPRRSTRPSV